MKFMIHDLRFTICKAILLALVLGPQVRATPVLFPLNQMFGGAGYVKTFLLEAQQTFVTDGTNAWVGSSKSVTPSGGTNPIVLLTPNTYLVIFPDGKFPWRIQVPDSTNVLNAISLTSGPIPSALFTSTTLVNNATGTNVNLSGTFTGNGGGLTNLSAAKLTGTLPSFTNLPPGTVTNNYSGPLTLNNNLYVANGITFTNRSGLPAPAVFALSMRTNSFSVAVQDTNLNLVRPMYLPFVNAVNSNAPTAGFLAMNPDGSATATLNGGALTNLNLRTYPAVAASAILDFTNTEQVVTSNITFIGATNYPPATNAMYVGITVLGSGIVVGWPQSWTPSQANTATLTNGLIAVKAYGSNIFLGTYQP